MRLSLSAFALALLAGSPALAIEMPQLRFRADVLNSNRVAASTRIIGADLVLSLGRSFGVQIGTSQVHFGITNTNMTYVDLHGFYRVNDALKIGLLHQRESSSGITFSSSGVEAIWTTGAYNVEALIARTVRVGGVPQITRAEVTATRHLTDRWDMSGGLITATTNLPMTRYTELNLTGTYNLGRAAALYGQVSRSVTVNGSDTMLAVGINLATGKGGSFFSPKAIVARMVTQGY